MSHRPTAPYRRYVPGPDPHRDGWIEAGVSDHWLDAAARHPAVDYLLVHVERFEREAEADAALTRYLAIADPWLELPAEEAVRVWAAFQEAKAERLEATEPARAQRLQEEATRTLERLSLQRPALWTAVLEHVTHEPQTVRQIARRVGRGIGLTRQALEGLEAEGLVTRAAPHVWVRRG